MNNTPPYIIGEHSISIYIGDKPNNIPETHPNFKAIREKIRTKAFDEILDLIDIPTAVVRFGQGKIKVYDGVVHYEDQPIHNVLADRIIAMMGEGFDIAPMVAFFENLLQNPSRSAVEELYLFMEKGQLPLTPDGYFLAYKKVREDYGSYYDNGATMNRPGSIVEMPRRGVDDRRDNTCSYGLHFCSESYLPHYMGSQGKVVIVKINPKDVVSIPSDYENAKGRACRYEVVGELDYDFSKEDMGSSVCSDDDEDEFDEDEFDDDESEFEVKVAALTHDGSYAIGFINVYASEQQWADRKALEEYDVQSFRWEDKSGISVDHEKIDPATIRVPGMIVVPRVN